MSDFVKEITEKYKNNVAFEIRRKIVRERVYYKDLETLVNKTTTYLKNQGLTEGDKFLIIGLNCPEYAVLLMAAMNSGITAIPLDYRSSEELINKVLQQTQTKVVFSSKYLNTSYLNKQETNVIEIESLFHNIKILEASDASNVQAIAEIVYTSGTTGEPKGVVIKSSTLLQNINALEKRIPRLKRYETISILPLSHMLEQTVGLFLMLKLGGKIIYVPKITSKSIFGTLEENTVTHLVTVPAMFDLILDKIYATAQKNNKLEQLNKSLKYSRLLPNSFKKIVYKDIHNKFGKSFKYFGSGGAPLNMNTAKVWKNMGFTILEGYGATEVMGAVCFSDPSSNQLGTVGKPLEGVELKLDQDNQILIKADFVSEGYYQNTIKTNERFENGWYKSGDIGMFDNQGNLIIKGREDNKIVLKSGQKVYAEDLERVINSFPQIKESCVLENNGEIFAYIVLRDTNTDVKELFSKINEQLESKQQVKNYSKWPEDEFPKTHTLKIDRKTVRAVLEGKNLSDLGKKLISIVKEPLDIISNIAGIVKTQISENDTLVDDLMLDSLTRLELIAQVEEYFEVEISEGFINKKTTVKDLIGLIENKTNKTDTQEVNLVTWPHTKWGQIISVIFNKLVLHAFHGRYIKLKIDGQEALNNIKKEKGFIAVFNHPGIGDGLCVTRTLYKENKLMPVTLSLNDFWQKGKTIKINRLLETAIGAMPLYPNPKDFLKELRFISDLLDRGKYLLYAPQGNLQRHAAQQDKFKYGIGFIAKELNKPVYTFYIQDYEKLWPPPQTTLEEAGIKELLPKAKGVVTVKVSGPLIFTEKQSVAEISNIIEEQFIN